MLLGMRDGYPGHSCFYAPTQPPTQALTLTQPAIYPPPPHVHPLAVSIPPPPGGEPSLGP